MEDDGCGCSNHDASNHDPKQLQGGKRILHGHFPVFLSAMIEARTASPEGGTNEDINLADGFLIQRSIYPTAPQPFISRRGRGGSHAAA
jgi:hypothetical protein